MTVVFNPNWHYFPCQQNGKKPATIGGFTHGFLGATNNIGRLKTLQSSAPDLNWGINCEISEIFVVDVDPMGFKNWADILDKNSELADLCAATYSVRTPRGGWHYYFTGVGRSSVSRIAVGIDTRGIGGYVLAVGSRIGPNKYDAIHHVTPKPAPQYLINWAEPSISKDRNGEYDASNRDTEIALAKANEIISVALLNDNVSVAGAGGNQRAYIMAAKLLEVGVSINKAVELLMGDWNSHCIPPWSREEIFRIVKNAANYGQETANAGKSNIINAFATLAVEEPLSNDFGRYTIRQIVEARAKAVPERWLLENLLPEIGVIILYGDSGTYKSFLSLDWALTLSSGAGNHWRASCDKKTVLYMAAEGGNALVTKRADAWLAQNNEVDLAKSEIYFTYDIPPLRDIKGWADIKAQISTLGINPDLIILDTFSRAISGYDENSAKDIAIVLAFAREISDYFGAAIMYVHHTGKDKKSDYRGSSAIRANVDTMIKVDRFGDNNISIKPVKHKDSDTGFDVKLTAHKFENTLYLKPFSGVEQAANSETVVWLEAQYIYNILELAGGTMDDAAFAMKVAEDFGLDASVAKKQIVAARKNPKYTSFIVGNLWKRADIW